MTEWREVMLGDVCERVTVGHVGKMADEYVDEGVPFLRSQNVRPFTISSENLLRISARFHRRLAKSRLLAGDVVVVRTGYPGTAAVVPQKFDGSNCADLVVITPSDELNPHLLAAIFNSTWGRSAVNGQLVGSAQQHFNVGSAKALRVRLPFRKEQDRIADVLCALSDLIENNRRRIELLEQMAQATYREWFVRFRYPGHEDVTFVDSPLGPIPGGWEVAVSGDLTRRGVLDIGDGYRAKNSEMTSGHVGLPFVRVGNVRDGFLALDDCDQLPLDYAGRLKSKVSRPGDSVICMKGTVGRCALVGPEYPSMAYSPQVSFWRSLDFASIPPSFVHLWIRSSAFRDQCAAVKGATDMADYVNLKDQRRMRILVPDRGCLASFDATVGPLLSTRSAVRAQIWRLVAIRDLLLPRLVTGKIDVSKLDLDALVGSVG